MATASHGTTFKFTPYGGEQATVGKLSSIGEIAPESDEIDVTTLDSPGGAREFIQGARDPGEIELEGFFSKTDAGQACLRAAYFSGATGQALITFPDGATAAFSGFVKGFAVGAADVEGAIGFKATIRLTGAITFTTA